MGDGDGSGPRNAKIGADLANEQLFDFRVPGNRAAAIELRMVAPGVVVAAFSQQAAAVLTEVAQRIPALHRARANSS